MLFLKKALISGLVACRELQKYGKSIPVLDISLVYEDVLTLFSSFVRDGDRLYEHLSGAQGSSSKSFYSQSSPAIKGREKLTNKIWICINNIYLL